MIDPETSQLIQAQMIHKMEYYRSMLKQSLNVITGNCKAVDVIELKSRIEFELRLNPEWEVLEHLPHIEFPPTNANYPTRIPE